ncbi:hypothetical protein J6590_078187 [Homalodisca vitripennis]|nr:hypothetical protein J6590_078187 [Homalodisca vitripennis]
MMGYGTTSQTTRFVCHSRGRNWKCHRTLEWRERIRWCHNDGVWDNLTDYTAFLSQPRPDLEMPSDTGVDVATTIYAMFSE